MPHGGPGQEQRALAIEQCGLEWGHRPTGGAEESHEPAGAQAVEALVKGGLAHRIVDHVYAFAAGETLHLLRSPALHN